MICPVEIAREMSALRAARVGDHAKHGFLFEGRDGAGDESARSNVASDGQEDHLVASGGDYRHQRPPDAALARTAGGVWLWRLVRPPAWTTFPQASPFGDSGTGVGIVSRSVFR